MSVEHFPEENSTHHEIILSKHAVLVWISLKFGFSAVRNSKFVSCEERMRILLYITFALENVTRMEEGK